MMKFKEWLDGKTNWPVYVLLPVHSRFLVVGHLERRNRVEMVAGTGGAARLSGLYERYPVTLLAKDFPTEEALRHKLQENCERFGNYLYPGAERKPAGERFIVIEDAPRTHAGDLRHRLWSDGKIESYYPWKSEGGAK